MSPTARAFGASAHVAYGVYAWVALLATVLPLCLLLALAPGLQRRRRLARGAAKLFLGAIGSPARLEGGRLRPHDACIVVANHASYLDGIILTAALPPTFTYLIKHDMATFPLAGFVLRRLGSMFVNRDDLLHRKRIARRLLELAIKGDSLAFFPEGTFDAAPGLKAFHPGAFSAAARAGLPIVPVVIFGSRHKLRSGAALASRGGALRVRICGRVEPREHDSPREVMRATRRAMLAELGEPDLDPEATSRRSSVHRLPRAAPR